MKVSIEEVPPSNILNYDETNFSDDPGRKKLIFKRGVKYPERIMNATKANVSVMCSATGDGKLLPVYIVYKAEHIYSSWKDGGPPGAHIGRSKSGWFDMANFEEYFEKIALAWARRKEGICVTIGDNLSSHVNP